MRNTKMNFKIFFLTMLFLISLNSVSGYEVYEGEIESTGYSQTTNNVGYVSSTSYDINAIGIKEGGLAPYLTSATLMMDISAWGGSTEYAHFKQDVTYEYNSETVGSGYMYYWLQSTDSDPAYEKAYVKCYFDNGLDLTAGHKIVNIVGFTGNAKFQRSNSYNIEGGSFNEKSTFIGKYGSTSTMTAAEGTHKAFHTVSFYNNYSYYYNEDLFTFYLNRNDANPSELTIDNTYVELIAEEELQNNPIYVYSDDITNHTWNIDILDSLGLTHDFQIDFIPTPEDTTPTLIFNQSTYYINETMEYEYTYLDYLHITDKFYDLVFYYYNTDDTIEYLYIQPLADYDNTGYLNTYGWMPKKLYYGVIDNSLNYETSQTLFLNNVKLSNSINLTYNYEFIYISCEGSYCQYENGNSFIITYNSFDNYTLNVKDNSSVIVQSLGNIKGFGTISYTIPYDNQKQYTYPYWSISFNESYENVIVFWTIEEDEINYQDEVVNESIQANIDEIKEGVKPLFDLVFGLSTIIVDNPDYDNNGVTSSSELDRWFNSIISIVILLSLYIFYKGLKDRGSK